MTPRLRRYAINRHIRDVRRDALRDLLLHGARVEVVHGDGGADVEEGVVDGVFGREGREDEELGGAWDYRGIKLSMVAEDVKAETYLDTCQGGGKQGR